MYITNDFSLLQGWGPRHSIHLLSLWPASQKLRPPLVCALTSAIRRNVSVNDNFLSEKKSQKSLDYFLKSSVLCYFGSYWTGSFFLCCVLPSDLWPFYWTAPLPSQCVRPPTLAAGFYFHAWKMLAVSFFLNPMWVEILNGGHVQ